MEQPKISAGLTSAQASAASLTRSQRRLANLGFDPMQALVDSYNAVSAEIRYQEKLRSGEVVEKNAKGQPKAFYPDHLYALYDKQIAIGDKLMRYGYARTPETNTVETNTVKPINIILRGGGKKVVGASG